MWEQMQREWDDLGGVNYVIHQRDRIRADKVWRKVPISGPASFKSMFNALFEQHGAWHAFHGLAKQPNSHARSGVADVVYVATWRVVREGAYLLRRNGERIEVTIVPTEVFNGFQPGSDDECRTRLAQIFAEGDAIRGVRRLVATGIVQLT